ARPVYTDDPIDVLNIKLKRMKKFFKGWGSNNFGKCRIKKNLLRFELQELELLEEQYDLCGEVYTRKLNILVELNSIYLEEESCWHQKSTERWLLKGDNNTDFFHKVANGRRGKNMMRSLECGSVTIEGTNNLLAHATDFYKELFGPAPGNMCSVDASLWSSEENISLTDNDELTKPFSLEEIKAALFAMEPNRAPGPDSVPVDFYQHCWDVVCMDLLRLFEWFHEGRLDVQRLNYGIITLLPKTS
uniref:Reverse transcriptase domain-containing protein n=1 Tax=Aegilops tauschii subsp. strangulata TaxID=200361 RepID=A0A453J5C2_AEGTS